MTEQQGIVKILQDLAATCRDAEDCFNKAAKGVHNDELRSRFDRYSVERGQFANELDQAVQQNGGAPGDTGHGSGLLRRGWKEPEARIRPKGDVEMAQQAADGEESGLKHYDHALAANLPDDIRSLLERQRPSIRVAIDELRGVRTRGA